MRASEAFDPYAILGVTRSATDAEIRAAYLALVARYHPDKHQGNPLENLAAERMAAINRAYDILSNPDRRADYDRAPGTGSTGPAAAPSDAGFGFGMTGRRSSRGIKIIAILMALPLLLRFGGFLARGVAALFRAMAKSTGLLRGLRGTPLFAALAVLAAVVLTMALLRRKKR